MTNPEIQSSQSQSQPWMEKMLAKFDINIFCVKALTRRYLIRSYRSVWSSVMAIITPLVVLLFFGPALNNITSLESTASQESMAYMNYLLPGIVAMALVYSALYASSEIIQSDKITHFQDILTLTPNTPKSLTIGYAFGGIIQAFVNVTIVSGITLFFNPRITASVSLFYFLLEILVTLMGIALFVVLGIIIAKKVQWQNFNILLSLLTLPFIYLSTIFAPIESYGILKYAVAFNPISLLLDIYRYPLTQLTQWQVIYPWMEPPFGILLDLVLIFLIMVISLWFCFKTFEQTAQNITKESVFNRIKTRIIKSEAKPNNILSTLAIDESRAKSIQTHLLQHLGRETLDKVYQNILTGHLEEAKHLISQSIDSEDLQRIFEIF